jgi:hypothetical protein
MDTVDMIFYSSERWESGGPGRVTYDSSANSMLQFRLKRRGYGSKRYQKMKQRQRACFSSMRRNCDTVRRCDDVGQRRGGTEERKGRR